MRILLAPIEIAGQMATAARALRKLGLDAVSCNYSYKKNTYGYTCDVNLGPDQKRSVAARKVSQLIFIFTSVFRFDVFHFNFGKTLLRKNRDIAFLKRLDKKLVMEFWGDDVRTNDSKEFGNDAQPTVKRRQNITKKLSRLGRYMDAALVADLELKKYVAPFFKRVEFVPQRIELDKFLPCYPDPDQKRPLIVHAPTHRAIKGTKYILEAVARLKSKYPLDFHLIEGLKHTEAKKLYERADVVVDQLRIGTYGVLAVESMALGKPVISYIRDEVRDSYPESLPIMTASQESIHDVLGQLIVNGNLRYKIGIQSRKYVEDYHELSGPWLERRYSACLGAEEECSIVHSNNVIGHPQDLS